MGMICSVMTRRSAHLELPLAFAVKIEELVIDVSAFIYGDTVIFYARGAAGADPFDAADVGHFNSGLDTALKHFETYRAR